MRSAERGRPGRGAAPLLATWLLAACASTPLPESGSRAPAPSLASPLASAPAAPASPTAAPSAGPAVEVPAGAGGAADDAAPVDPAVREAFESARAALVAGRADEAERMFVALAEAHPDLGGAHASLGLIHRRAGRLDAAAAAFEQAVRASPGQPLYWNQLGATYRQLGAFAKARAAYEQAIALAPGYAAPVLNLGILNDLYLNDPSQALVLYERYQQLLPEADGTVGKWVADLKNRKGAERVVSRGAP